MRAEMAGGSALVHVKADDLCVEESEQSVERVGVAFDGLSEFWTAARESRDFRLDNCVSTDADAPCAALASSSTASVPRINDTRRLAFEQFCPI